MVWTMIGMNETTNPAPVPPPGPGSDPRPLFASAARLVGTTLAAVRPDQFGDPTPCPEYDVRTLSNHLVAVARRVAVIGRGGEPFSVPNFAPDVSDGDWPKAWDEAVREIESVWSAPDMLGRPVTLPFGTLPGAIALVVYSNEFTLHTWDLAVATGQDPAWDPAVLAMCLGAMKRAVPAVPRTAPVPFGPVVEVPDDAADIDKLAAWYGRSR